uniref:ZP domain-containing protein n=1 Tax=Latimeria chalumnae TaxID=7897 RepID=H3B5G6_LATCH
DAYGRVYELTPQFATQCGYTVHRDFWDDVDFYASLSSCYSQSVNDLHFTLIVQIKVFTTKDRKMAFNKIPSFTPPPHKVSVRKEVPPISTDFVSDQAEDWEMAVPHAAAGEYSIWQVVFHLPKGQLYSMLARDAYTKGYGINTTVSRLLLRAAYNATEHQKLMIQGTNFSIIRSSTFYKQRWMILMVDTAVACPVDEVEVVNGGIVWTIPRIVLPLVLGTKSFKAVSVEMGVDARQLDKRTIDKRNYTLTIDATFITIKIPLGAEGGYYKSHVVNGQYGITYSINLLLDHIWMDDFWEETKYTIIKPVITPFDLRTPVVVNNTEPNTRIFNVTIGTFLTDVELVAISIGPEHLTITEANSRGYNVQEVLYPDDLKGYTLEIPFDDPNIEKKYIIDTFRTYTLNITYHFNVLPWNDPFTHPAKIVVGVHDVVLPKAVGFCDQHTLYLLVTHGNLDQTSQSFIGNTQLTPQSAEKLGYEMTDNSTHLMVGVPHTSHNVVYEKKGIDRFGLRVSLELNLKDQKNQIDFGNFSVSCSFSTKNLIACFPNGTMRVTALNFGVPDMDLMRLELRDNCAPRITNNAAVFEFNVNTCGTYRKFSQKYMIYENEVSYYQPGVVEPVYRLAVACHYLLNDTLTFRYGFQDNPVPEVKPGYGLLALIMRLSKDEAYTSFYKDTEYPIVKFLGVPLYFEIELLYSKDPQLELFLQDCWATAFPDRNSNPQWDIIINSCANSDDSDVSHFYPVIKDARVKFPMHFKRFDVVMFAFLQNEMPLSQEISFHCSVVICDANDPASDLLCAGKCIPGKQRARRSAVQHNYLHGYVSSGAVML